MADTYPLRWAQLPPDYPGVKGTVAANGQTYDPPGRYLIVSTAGTLTGKLEQDEADVAYVLPVGVHKLAVRSITSLTTLVGVIVQ